MPVVEAHLLQGYSADDKTRLTEALTNAIRYVVPAADEAITVLLQEYPKEAYARGGVQRDPAPALPDPKSIVLTYLSAMEKRDLDAAAAMLGDGFSMTFPGPVTMKTLSELVAWSKPRYQYVTKTYEKVEAFHSDGAAVVYTHGSLAGKWPDGRAFEGIRFIDRFELKAGKITRQDVWNDLAEVRSA